MAVKIITDSSADLPSSILEQLDISVVPLSVHFEHDQYKSDIDLKMFYDKMKTERELPKTSSPSPGDFYEQFQKAGERDDILCISLSSQLSSTYHHAVMGMEMMEEQQGIRSIQVLDSKNASLGLGIIVYKAAMLAKEGCSMQELVKSVKQNISDVRNYFVLDTLENVIRGGRLDRVRGAIASVLNIKLLMRASDEGTIEVVEKVRGTQNALKKLIDKIGEAGHPVENQILAIAHSNCEERAREVRDDILKRYPFREVIVSEMGPVIGTYAGEGAILVACS